MKYTKPLIFTLFFIVLSSSFAQAMLTRPASVDELVELSSCVFKGEVTDVTEQYDEYESGYMVKYFTVQIQDALKGDCSGEYVFKQLASPSVRLPECAKGNTCVFFLPEASEKTGLVAPVGITQGLYKVVEVNGQESLMGNKRILNSVRAASKGLSLSTSASTSEYENFKSIIKNIAEGE